MRELYGVAPEEFVSRRDELARELRRGGDREAAERVKALRKPTVAAWTVNRLARVEPRLVESVLAAGEGLRSEHRKLLAGGSPAGIQEARERERDAIRALADAARALLEEEGRGTVEPTVERVTETLHAAALDEELAGRVREGRVEKESEAAGFGFDAFSGAEPAETPKRAAAKRDRRAEREEAARAKEADAKERLREARRAVKEAERAYAERARELEQAERELARRRAAAEAAERDLERAARARRGAR